MPLENETQESLTFYLKRLMELETLLNEQIFSIKKEIEYIKGIKNARKS